MTLSCSVGVGVPFRPVTEPFWGQTKGLDCGYNRHGVGWGWGERETERNSQRGEGKREYKCLYVIVCLSLGICQKTGNLSRAIFKHSAIGPDASKSQSGSPILYLNPNSPPRPRSMLGCPGCLLLPDWTPYSHQEALPACLPKTLA